MDQLLYLKAGIDVYVIEGFIPHIHMGLLAKAAGQQYLFLLSLGQIFQVLFKLDPGKIHFTQNGLE